MCVSVNDDVTFSGNILSNSDVGVYEYNAVMPHGVTDIAGTYVTPLI